MKKIETTTDGWDCVPELMKAVRLIGEIVNDFSQRTHCQGRIKITENRDMDTFIRNADVIKYFKINGKNYFTDLVKYLKILRIIGLALEFRIFKDIENYRFRFNVYNI